MNTFYIQKIEVELVARGGQSWSCGGKVGHIGAELDVRGRRSWSHGGEDSLAETKIFGNLTVTLRTSFVNDFLKLGVTVTTTDGRSWPIRPLYPRTNFGRFTCFFGSR